MMEVGEIEGEGEGEDCITVFMNSAAVEQMDDILKSTADRCSLGSVTNRTFVIETPYRSRVKETASRPSSPTWQTLPALFAVPAPVWFALR